MPETLLQYPYLFVPLPAYNFMQTTTPPEKLRVALYIRVSTDEQADKYGLDMQKDALINLVKSRGEFWTLAGDNYIYIDDGVSGTIPMEERPAFAQLMEDLANAPEDNKPFDIVAVYKIDRFARRLKILLSIIDFFEEGGIKFVSANESIDTTTPFGKAILGIIGVIAELEIETLKQRTNDGRGQAIKQGKTMNTYATYGYTKNEQGLLEILESEASIVREIFHMFLNEKKSTADITKHLIEIECPSPEASAILNKKKRGETQKKNPFNFWRPEQVRIILQDEIYIGKYFYNKKLKGKRLPKEQWKLSPFEFPKIIDVLTFEKTQRLLESSKHVRKESSSKHIYLLGGLLTCDACHSGDENRIRWTGDRKEITKGSGKFTYSYKCGRKNSTKHSTTCHTIPLPAEEIENYILGFTKRLLENPLATYNHQQKLQSSKNALRHLQHKQKTLAKLINAFPDRRKQYREQHLLKIIDGAELTRQYAELAEKEARCRKEMADVDYQIAQNSLSAGYEQSLALFSAKYGNALEGIAKNREDAHTLLHALIDEIIVYSRPIKDNDIIAGKRKKNQMIPYRLHIKLKLPQDILQTIQDGSGQKIVSCRGAGIRTLSKWSQTTRASR